VERFHRCGSCIGCLDPSIPAADLRTRERAGAQGPSGATPGQIRRLADNTSATLAAMLQAAVQSSPDVLVLGGGGILGEAWMTALLAGLDESAGFDSRACGCYIGTSAGSIVAASLIAGLAPQARLGGLPEQPAVPQRQLDAGTAPLRQALEAAANLGGSMAAPLVSVALNSTAASGALLRRAALRRVPPGRRSLAGLARLLEAEADRWDGRLRVAAVELETGRRVMFGSPGAPQASVSAAVQASCAIPGVFRPVRIGARSYVDGGVWSPTNMDTAEVRRGGRVLCLNPTGSLQLASGALAGALGAMSRGLVAAEALTLKRRGASVSTVNPDDAAAASMGTSLMDPARRSAVIEAGLAQGRRLAALGERDAA
jgi:NTE family protein